MVWSHVKQISEKKGHSGNTIGSILNYRKYQYPTKEVRRGKHNEGDHTE